MPYKNAPSSLYMFRFTQVPFQKYYISKIYHKFTHMNGLLEKWIFKKKFFSFYKNLLYRK